MIDRRAIANKFLKKQDEISEKQRDGSKTKKEEKTERNTATRAILGETRVKVHRAVE